MRIIAGSCKGRRLEAPSWEGLRPTSDRLRETLFNVLAPRVAGARVLDVFAGTGAVGLEALSRGAASAVFIEHDRRAADLIARNATACQLVDRCAIIRDAAERALRHPLAGSPFDLIVLDPPYASAGVDAVVDAALAQLATHGLAVLEHAARRPVPAVGRGRVTRTLRAGDSTLTFLEPTFQSGPPAP